MPLEINASGFVHAWVADENGGDRAPYPWLPFWEVVADEGATAMINTDAHNPARISADVDRAFAIAERAGVRLTAAPLGAAGNRQ
jgi:histidinol phosphatase-like PHP family hydrolase